MMSAMCELCQDGIAELRAHDKDGSHYFCRHHAIEWTQDDFDSRGLRITWNEAEHELVRSINERLVDRL